jgi:hypothetical protein
VHPKTENFGGCRIGFWKLPYRRPEIHFYCFSPRELMDLNGSRDSEISSLVDRNHDVGRFDHRVGCFADSQLQLLRRLLRND